MSGVSFRLSAAAAVLLLAVLSTQVSARAVASSWWWRDNTCSTEYQMPSGVCYAEYASGEFRGEEYVHPQIRECYTPSYYLRWGYRKVCDGEPSFVMGAGGAVIRVYSCVTKDDEGNTLSRRNTVRMPNARENLVCALVDVEGQQLRGPNECRTSELCTEGPYHVMDSNSDVIGSGYMCCSRDDRDELLGDDNADTESLDSADDEESISESESTSDSADSDSADSDSADSDSADADDADRQGQAALALDGAADSDADESASNSADSDSMSADSDSDSADSDSDSADSDDDEPPRRGQQAASLADRNAENGDAESASNSGDSDSDSADSDSADSDSADSDSADSDDDDGDDEPLRRGQQAALLEAAEDADASADSADSDSDSADSDSDSADSADSDSDSADSADSDSDSADSGDRRRRRN